MSALEVATCPACGKPAHEGRCKVHGRPSLPDLLEALAAHLRAEERERAQAPMPLLTPAAVAARLGVARNTVYQLAVRGQLPSIRFGGAVRFEADAVERFIRVRRAA